VIDEVVANGVTPDEVERAKNRLIADEIQNIGTVNHAPVYVREVAKRAGESLTEAIRTSLEERLQRLSGKKRAATRKEKLFEILRRVDSLPRKNDLTEDEILGYDEHGIPR